VPIKLSEHAYQKLQLLSEIKKNDEKKSVGDKSATNSQTPSSHQEKILQLLYENQAPNYNDRDPICQNQLHLVFNAMIQWQKMNAAQSENGLHPNLKDDEVTFKTFHQDFIGQKLQHNSKELKQNGKYGKSKELIENIFYGLQYNDTILIKQKLSIYCHLIKQLGPNICGPGLLTSLEFISQQLLSNEFSVTASLQKLRENVALLVAEQFSHEQYLLANGMNAHVHKAVHNHLAPIRGLTAWEEENQYRVDLFDSEKKEIENHFDSQYTPDPIIHSLVTDVTLHLCKKLKDIAVKPTTMQNLSSELGKIFVQLSIDQKDIPTEKIFECLEEKTPEEKVSEQNVPEQKLNQQDILIKITLSPDLPPASTVKTIPKNQFRELIYPYIIRHLIQQNIIKPDKYAVCHSLSNEKYTAVVLHSCDNESQYSWIEENNRIYSYLAYVKQHPDKISDQTKKDFLKGDTQLIKNELKKLFDQRLKQKFPWHIWLPSLENTPINRIIQGNNRLLKFATYALCAPFMLLFFIWPLPYAERIERQTTATIGIIVGLFLPIVSIILLGKSIYDFHKKKKETKPIKKLLTHTSQAADVRKAAGAMEKFIASKRQSSSWKFNSNDSNSIKALRKQLKEVTQIYKSTLSKPPSSYKKISQTIKISNKLPHDDEKISVIPLSEISSPRKPLLETPRQQQRQDLDIEMSRLAFLQQSP